MIPIDGCSINPTRSFGPALLALTRMEAPKAVEPAASMVGEPSGAEVVPEAHAMSDDNAGPSFWRDMWIFWIGPLLGASLAALVYKAMIMLDLSEREDVSYLNFMFVLAEFQNHIIHSAKTWYDRPHRSGFFHAVLPPTATTWPEELSDTSKNRKHTL